MVRVHASRRSRPEELRRRALRLDHLPLRPATARLVMNSFSEDRLDDDTEAIESSKVRSICALDPGWILARSRGFERISPLELIAARPWWPRAMSTGPIAELLGRLWRHSIAVGITARGLAREAGDPDPEFLALVGPLCSLGYWAVAAVDPEWLREWWHLEDPRGAGKSKKTWAWT